jgi:hypothetical protein
MGIGLTEAIVILVILLVITFWLVIPIGGIVRANRRLKQRQHSTGAVVWPVVNLVLIGSSNVYTLGSGGGFSFYGLSLLALNGIWLFCSLRANRAARSAA